MIQMMNEIRSWIVLLRSMVYLKIVELSVRQGKKCNDLARYYLMKYDELHKED